MYNTVQLQSPVAAYVSNGYYCVYVIAANLLWICQHGDTSKLPSTEQTLENGMI